MQTTETKEEKRNDAWRMVMTAATALIIVIAAYFLYRGFFGNPLEGRWVQDESNLTLEINRGEEAILTWNELFEGKELQVNLEYTLNKSDKQIAFHVDRDELAEAAEELGEGTTASDVESAIDSMLTTFNYNLEGRELTLTEWDYGDQYLFTRVK